MAQTSGSKPSVVWALWAGQTSVVWARSDSLKPFLQRCGVQSSGHVKLWGIKLRRCKGLTLLWWAAKRHSNCSVVQSSLCCKVMPSAFNFRKMQNRLCCQKVSIAVQKQIRVAKVPSEDKQLESVLINAAQCKVETCQKSRSQVIKLTELLGSSYTQFWMVHIDTQPF